MLCYGYCTDAVSLLPQRSVVSLFKIGVIMASAPWGNWPHGINPQCNCGEQLLPFQSYMYICFHSMCAFTDLVCQTQPSITGQEISVFRSSFIFSSGSVWLFTFNIILLSEIFTHPSSKIVFDTWSHLSAFSLHLLSVTFYYFFPYTSFHLALQNWVSTLWLWIPDWIHWQVGFAKVGLVTSQKCLIYD